MEINIINEKENKAINRKEINFEINYTQAPPKKVAARKELSKLIKSDENLILIRKMSNAFGKRKMVCIAHIYPDEKILKKFEPEYLIKRIKVTEEPKEKVEEKTEEKPEEVKEEEKTEEVKEEEKTEEKKEEFKEEKSEEVKEEKLEEKKEEVKKKEKKEEEAEGE